MRTMLRGKATLLFMMLGMLLAVPAIALADDISNNLDTSVDAVAEDMPLTMGAGTAAPSSTSWSATETARTAVT